MKHSKRLPKGRQGSTTLKEKGEGAEEVLSKLREDYWQGISEDGEDEEEQNEGIKTHQYLLFRIRNRYFAFETCYCRQVYRVPEIVPLPAVPKHILGIINLRGRVVSVTSLARLLDMEEDPKGSSARLIVIGDGSVTTAMMVDCVDKIVELGADEVQATEGSAPGRDYAQGEVLLDDHLVILLSVGQIVNSPDMFIDFRRSEER